MWAALCFTGGAHDSLRLRDCCWDFPGEVNVAEARFQGEFSPDTDVEERVTVCVREQGLSRSARVCSARTVPGSESEGPLGGLSWQLSWGLPKEPAQSLTLSVLCGRPFF